MFSSYLIPLSTVDEEDTLAVVTIVDEDTLPVAAPVVGIAMAALVGLIIVVAVVVAVAVFARWWKGKNSGAFDLTTDVSMECSMQTPYCVLQEFVYIAEFVYGTRCCLTFVYDDVVCRTGYRIAENLMGLLFEHFDSLVENLRIELCRWLYNYLFHTKLYIILHLSKLCHFWSFYTQAEGKTGWANVKVCIVDKMNLRVAVK